MQPDTHNVAQELAMVLDDWAEAAGETSHMLDLSVSENVVTITFDSGIYTLTVAKERTTFTPREAEFLAALVEDDGTEEVAAIRAKLDALADHQR